jgi:hypothetical protein
MVCLRRKTQVDKTDALLKLGFLFDRVYLYGKIRAPKFAHPASDAVLWPGRKNLAVSELQHMFGAESNADTATLAIILPDNMKEPFFGFSHLFALACCSPHSI